MNPAKKEIDQHREFFHHLTYPQFRGLCVFANIKDLNRWMERFGLLLEGFGGTYVTSNKVWNFPWGAQLKLQIINKLEDNLKIRGIELSDVEYDSGVNLNVVDRHLISAMLRITLPKIKDKQRNDTI